MSGQQPSIHLGDLLGMVRRYQADRDHAIDRLADQRVPEILRKSGRLTPEQMRLIDDAIAAGRTLDQIRVDGLYLSGVEERGHEGTRLVADAMCRALSGAIAGISADECRTWGKREWAREFRCPVDQIPTPAAVVRMYDFRQLAVPLAIARQHALNELQAERNGPSSEEVEKAPIWEFAAQEIVRRAKFDTDIDELSECVGLMSLSALPGSNEISRHIAALDDAGITAELLARLWEEYPGEAEAIGLPLVVVTPQAVSESAHRPVKRNKRGRPKAYNSRTDRRIAEAWKTGQYSSKVQLARAFGLERADVFAALERDRKRRAGSRGGRKK